MRSLRLSHLHSLILPHHHHISGVQLALALAPPYSPSSLPFGRLHESCFSRRNDLLSKSLSSYPPSASRLITSLRPPSPSLRVVYYRRSFRCCASVCVCVASTLALIAVLYMSVSLRSSASRPYVYCLRLHVHASTVCSIGCQLHHDTRL